METEAQQNRTKNAKICHVLNIRYCRDGAQRCRNYYLIILFKKRSTQECICRCCTFDALPHMLSSILLFAAKKDTHTHTHRTPFDVTVMRSKIMELMWIELNEHASAPNSQKSVRFTHRFRFRHKRNLMFSHWYCLTAYCWDLTRFNPLKLPHFCHSWHHWVAAAAAVAKAKRKHQNKQ